MSAVLDRSPRRIRHEARLRLLRVRRVETLTPRLRRVVLEGDLAGFTSAAPDDHVKLFLPAPGENVPVMPERRSDGPAWPEGVVRPVSRDYTPRRYDAAAGELTIDFVLHETGPASDWAAQARPGDRIGVGGPRGSVVLSDGYDATLLAGDETALPAIARRLEEARAGEAITAFVEVAGAGEELHLPTPANAVVTWLHRDGRPAGEHAALLAALEGWAVPQGAVLAWIAAEIEVARTLRGWLIERRGFARGDIHAAGYWRRGAEGTHQRLDD